MQRMQRNVSCKPKNALDFENDNIVRRVKLRIYDKWLVVSVSYSCIAVVRPNYFGTHVWKILNE